MSAVNLDPIPPGCESGPSMRGKRRIKPIRRQLKSRNDQPIDDSDQSPAEDQSLQKKSNRQFYRPAKIFYLYHRWHTRLNRSKRSLIREIQENKNHRHVDGVYISVEHETFGRLFTSFESPIELFNYIGKIKPYQRNFHELVVRGYQKPRFDIDVTLEDLNLIPSFRAGRDDPFKFLDRVGTCLVNLCLYGIMELMTQSFPPDSIQPFDPHRHLMIFKSHRYQDGQLSKVSYHLVIDGYYHPNFKEAKSFYRKVLDTFQDSCSGFPYSKLIDEGIYSRNHGFRLPYCTKMNEYRPKELLAQWNYECPFPGQGKVGSFPDQTLIYQFNEDYPHRDVALFYSALISFVDGCSPMPVLNHQEEKVHHSSRLISNNLAQEMVKMVPSSVGQLSINKVEGSIVSLRYETRGTCLICQRRHQSENCWLSLELDDSVKFHCWREEGASRHLGVAYLQEGDVMINPLHLSEIENSENDWSSSTNSGPGNRPIIHIFDRRYEQVDGSYQLVTMDPMDNSHQHKANSSKNIQNNQTVSSSSYDSNHETKSLNLKAHREEEILRKIEELHLKEQEKKNQKDQQKRQTCNLPIISRDYYQQIPRDKISNLNFIS